MVGAPTSRGAILSQLGKRGQIESLVWLATNLPLRNIFVVEKKKIVNEKRPALSAAGNGG